jgi:serine/threonine protein kinase
MTVINPELHEAPKTVINPAVSHQREGRFEPPLSPPGGLLAPGETICGKYTVERRLEVDSGEADLYVCAHDGRAFVAKVYKRRSSIKQDVAQLLLQIESPYVAKLFESSTLDGFPVEIMHYYKNGSIQGRVFTHDELEGMLIPNINEGLRVLHQAGIIHKDLKPSNIMMADDGESVAIVDFGISSVLTDPGSVVVTKTGMTPEYSAPETFKNLFLMESDYYSFGITIFELATGHAPYANMSAEAIGQYVSVQRIPFPENMPARLRDFISALTYYDITNRDNKVNPNRRWTHAEVSRWLAGEMLPIPGEGIGNASLGAMPSYTFQNESLADPKSLVAALAKHWDEGKKHLFRGYLSSHFRAFDHRLQKHCLDAEEEAGRTNGRDDIIFWKLLYKLDPELKGFYWKGQTFESLPAMGRELLEHLWKKDRPRVQYFESVMSERLLTEYVSLVATNNEQWKNVAKDIEDFYVLEKAEGPKVTRSLYLMAYTLSGQKLFNLDGTQFRTVGELAGFLRNTLEESYDNFERLCHKLVGYDGNLDFQLEIWLRTIGKHKELENWQQLMQAGT